MFFVLWSYLKSEVWLRRRELLAGLQPWLAVAAGVAVTWVGDDVGLGKTQLRDLIPGVLAYAAIGFGFSLAGLTIAITIPDTGFTQLLATAPPPSPDEPGISQIRQRRRRRQAKRKVPANAYSDLLFVFSWTAVVHWITLVWSVGLVVAYGLDHKFVPDGSCVARACAGVLAMLVIYAAMQFLTTVLTLSGLGSAYVSQLRSRTPTQREVTIGSEASEAAVAVEDTPPVGELDDANRDDEGPSP